VKIAFLQKYPFPYFGVMSLSAALPGKHSREVFVGDLEENITGAVARYAPDVLALPIMTLEYRWVRNTVSEIRSRIPGIKVVAGYIHPTSSPEMLNEDFVDAICLGEGDYSFPSYIENLDSGRREDPVPGFLIKTLAGVVSSPEPNLVPDLDALPEEDRALYYEKYPSLASEKLKHFMASRGCPFSCSFCCHQVYRRIYAGKGPYVRRKSPERTVREILSVRERWGLQSVCFLDDVFVMDVPWLREFASLYREKVGLPYFCAVTPPHMTEEIARLLAESGCHTVNFGVETADQKKRFEILNKRVTDAQMFECARLVKKYGMKLQTTVLFGLPGEAVEEAFENISFNIRLGADYMGSNVLLPFPNTGIEKFALETGVLESGYLEREDYLGIHLGSVFKFKDIEVIERVQKISQLALKFPFLIPFFRKLVRVRSRKLFFVFYVISSMWRYKSEKPISWAEVVRVFWRARKNYLAYAFGGKDPASRQGAKTQRRQEN